jgi:hypothetical protein
LRRSSTAASWNSPGLRMVVCHAAARFVEVQSGDGEISHVTAASLRPFHYGRTRQDQYRDIAISGRHV